MAGIDKTYTNSWKEYKEFIKWAEKQVFVCPNGMKLNLINYCYNWDKDPGKEFPVMNTSCSIDYFLIHYCPFKFVQDRMIEVYGEDYVKSVLAGASEYDAFEKLDKFKKLKIVRGKYFQHKNYLWKVRRYKPCFEITVHDKEGTLWYNKDYNTWVSNHELGYWTCNVAYRCKSVKALIRQIYKWHLPAGCTIRAEGRYYDEDLIIYTK